MLPKAFALVQRLKLKNYNQVIWWFKNTFPVYDNWLTSFQISFLSDILYANSMGLLHTYYRETTNFIALPDPGILFPLFCTSLAIFLFVPGLGIIFRAVCTQILYRSVGIDFVVYIWWKLFLKKKE